MGRCKTIIFESYAELLDGHTLASFWSTVESYIHTYIHFRHGVWGISNKNQDAIFLAIINVFSSIENSEYIIKTTNFAIMFQIKTIFWKSTLYTNLQI